MSLLLALLLSPAWAADLPQDPIEKGMVVSEEERRGAEELERTQELMQQLKALRQDYGRHGDLKRYTRDRAPVLQELWDHYARLMDVRTDIKTLHYNAGIVNALSVAAEMREGKKARAEGMVGPRMVQFTRLVSFDRQLSDAQGRVSQTLDEERDFFAAEQESVRQRKRLTLLAAAAFLALAAGGGALFFRLRRKP